MIGRAAERCASLFPVTDTVAPFATSARAIARPIPGFATRVSGSTDLSTAGGAAIVVVADRVGGSEWQGEDGLMLLKRLAQVAPRAVIVCAGASQAGLIDLGVRELGIDRRRLFGSAPEALAGGAPAGVAPPPGRAPRGGPVTSPRRPPAPPGVS